MGITTSIDVSYREVDGWHVFEAAAMPGFYVANADPRRAYSAIAPTLETLVKLDTGVDCRVAPEVPLDDFIGAMRADKTAARVKQQTQRFTLYKEAA